MAINLLHITVQLQILMVVTKTMSSISAKPQYHRLISGDDHFIRRSGGVKFTPHLWCVLLPYVAAVLTVYISNGPVNHE